MKKPLIGRGRQPRSIELGTALQRAAAPLIAPHPNPLPLRGEGIGARRRYPFQTRGSAESGALAPEGERVRVRGDERHSRSLQGREAKLRYLKPIERQPRCFALVVALLFLGASCALAQSAPVLPGVDVLIAEDFAPLRGKGVGLVTNQTGRTRDGRATIDVLREAPGVKLIALFAPEHGVRGERPAGASVKSYRDKITGLPVYSLYGATRKPTAAMLRGVQVLVFDLQEIGARSYTYLATLGTCMEACAERKIPFVVLDHPNPLGGAVEGNVPARFSFVCPFPLAYRHGMTIGEIARWLNAKRARRGHQCALQVVPLQNYRRTLTWEATGLTWLRTSPNIPYERSPYFYEATGLLGELPGLSIGIGTPWPFEVAGAPGLDAYALEAELNRRHLPGWEFRAASWTPERGRFAGRLCTGVEIHLTDEKRAQLTRLNFEIFDAVRRVAPGVQFFNSARHNKMFDAACGTVQIRRMLQAGKPAREVWNFWSSGAAMFEKQAAPFRLY